MALKQKLFTRLFYTMSLKKTDVNQKYGEFAKASGLTTHQIKKTLYVLEDWVHILYGTKDEEMELRGRLLSLAIQRHRHDYDGLVKRNNTFSRFFNDLVLFSHGSEDALHDLVNIVELDRVRMTYDLK